MNSKQYLVLGVLILAVAQAVADEPQKHKLTYMGSYTHLRRSDSGHIYINEFRLWRNSQRLYGIYLSVSGLEGGGISPSVNKIREGIARDDGEIIIKTKWYEFKGKYIDNRLEGELLQGSQIIWGGIEGSNKIVFSKGTNIRNIKVPEERNISVGELNRWIDSLPGKM